jgi:hypothetical protein
MVTIRVHASVVLVELVMITGVMDSMLVIVGLANPTFFNPSATTMAYARWVRTAPSVRKTVTEESVAVAPNKTVEEMATVVATTEVVVATTEAVVAASHSAVWAASAVTAATMATSCVSSKHGRGIATHKF